MLEQPSVVFPRPIGSNQRLRCEATGVALIRCPVVDADQSKVPSSRVVSSPRNGTQWVARSLRKPQGEPALRDALGPCEVSFPDVG